MNNNNINIRYNDDLEMMEITKDNKSIFFGNYNDFDSHPKGLKEFLEQLDFKVNIRKDNFKDLD